MLGCCGCGDSSTSDSSHVVTGEKKAPCSAIVSLAPSITSTLHHLGLSSNLVGVTNYCTISEKSGALRIGGYTDPSYERILQLQPDVVFLTQLHKKQKSDLERLGLHTVSLRAQRLSDIESSIETIGQACGVTQRSDALIKKMNQRKYMIKSAVAKQPKPRVLISIGRSMGTNAISDIFVAGKDTFYNDLVQLAGGQNSVEIETVQYPKISAEGVFELNPDIIIDLVVGAKEKGISVEQIRKQWDVVHSVNAVKQQRVYVIGQTYVTTPGPQIIDLLEQFAQLFHPSVYEVEGKALSKSPQPPFSKGERVIPPFKKGVRGISKKGSSI